MSGRKLLDPTAYLPQYKSRILESAWMELSKIAQFVKLTRRIKYNNLDSVHVMQKFWLVVYVIVFAQIWVR